MTWQTESVVTTPITEKPVPGPLRRLTRVRPATHVPGANPPGMRVGEAVAVGVALATEVADGVLVMLGVRVMDGVSVAEAVCDGVEVTAGVEVMLAVEVAVEVGGGAVWRR